MPWGTVSPSWACAFKKGKHNLSYRLKIVGVSWQSTSLSGIWSISYCFFKLTNSPRLKLYRMLSSLLIITYNCFLLEICSVRLQQILSVWQHTPKGTVSQDFCFIFFMNHLPPSPENNMLVISNFFQQFLEIFASPGAPPVSTTPVANFPPYQRH